MATADSNAFSVVIAPPVLPTYTGSGSAALGASIAASGNGTYVAPTLPTYSGSGTATLSATLGASGLGTYTVAGQAISYTGDPAPVQDLVVGIGYSGNLNNVFAGSFTPFTFSNIGDALPTGITLNGVTGEISGAPAAGTEGTYNPQWRGTDTDSNVADAPVSTWNVAPAPAGGGGIFAGADEVSTIYIGGTPITEVYQGEILIWPAGPSQGSYDNAILGLDPTCYYKMDESTYGAVADSSGNGNTMGPYNASPTIFTFGDTPMFNYTGTSIGSPAATAASARFMSNDATTPTEESTQFTVVGIINAESKSSLVIGEIFSFGEEQPTRTSGWYLNYNHFTQTMSLEIIGEGSLTSPVMPLNTDTWFAVKYNGSKASFWFDGIKTVSAETVDPPNFTASTKFGLMGRFGGYPLKGRLQRVAYFNKILLDAELANLNALVPR